MRLARTEVFRSLMWLSFIHVDMSHVMHILVYIFYRVSDIKNPGAKHLLTSFRITSTTQVVCEPLMGDFV